MKKTLWILALAFLCYACGSETKEENNTEQESENVNNSEESSEESDQPQYAQLGKISVTVDGKTYTTDRFIMEMPQFKKGKIHIQWFTKDVSEPKAICVLGGEKIQGMASVSGDITKQEKISGEITLDSQEKNRLLISLTFDNGNNGSGMITLSKGTANIKQFDKDGNVKLTAKGTGLYSPDVSQPSLTKDDFEASIEIDVEATRVDFDGEIIKNINK